MSRLAHQAALLAAWALLACPRAGAVSLDPSTFINATNEVISRLGIWVGLATDVRAFETSKPHSSIYGLDFGVTVTAVSLPGEVVDGLTKLGISNVPHYFPFPKINVHKGFTSRFQIGGEIIPAITIQGNKLYVYGGDLQWTAIERPRLPPIAIRAQANYTNLVFVKTTTVGGDLLATYEIFFLSVFGGGGYRYIWTEISNPTGTLPLIQGINFSPKADSGHFFGGLTARAGFVRLTLQADFTTRGVNSYGAKLSFFF